MMLGLMSEERRLASGDVAMSVPAASACSLTEARKGAVPNTPAMSLASSFLSMAGFPKKA
jgi:hypothetical protein